VLAAFRVAIQAKSQEKAMPKERKAKKKSKARARKSSVASRSSRKGTGRKKSANEMAGIRIDRFEDASATRAEKARRKKRLLEGPEEFRKIRSDRPKNEAKK
jgi:hypothetical protein